MLLSRLHRSSCTIRTLWRGSPSGWMVRDDDELGRYGSCGWTCCGRCGAGWGCCCGGWVVVFQRLGERVEDLFVWKEGREEKNWDGGGRGGLRGVGRRVSQECSVLLELWTEAHVLSVQDGRGVDLSRDLVKHRDPGCWSMGIV